MRFLERPARDSFLERHPFLYHAWTNGRHYAGFGGAILAAAWFLALLWMGTAKLQRLVGNG